MQAPPNVMPDRFGVVGLAALDRPGNFPSQDVGDRAAVAADGLGIADAFSAVGIVDANGDQFEGGDLAMRAVREGDGERDPVESGLDLADACHCASIRAFCETVGRSCRQGNRQALSDGNLLQMSEIHHRHARPLANAARAMFDIPTYHLELC
jgi:hypothetical protein